MSETNARRLAVAMGVARTLDRLLQAASDGAPPAELAKVNALRAKLSARAVEVEAMVARVYQEVYTPHEMSVLADFLESPVGQAMLSKQSKVEARIQEVTSAFIGQLMQSPGP